MTIVEFLLARIAEDEAEARDAIAERARVFGDDPRSSDPDMSLQSWPDVGVPAVLVGPERVLAECAARRAVITEAIECDREAEAMGFPTEFGIGSNRIFELMAAVYADHPDYDPAWRV